MKSRLPSAHCVIVIGTAAGTGQGGISTALPGYFDAMQRESIEYQVIVSHEAGSAFHKFGLYVNGLRALVRYVLSARRKQQLPILYIHMGPWKSMMRKWSFVLLGKALGAKVMCQSHSLSLDNYLSHGVGRFACKIFFAPIDRVLVLTEWWRVRLAGVGMEQLSVVPNPLPAHFEKMAHQDRAEHGDVHVNLLSMTRLVRGKGLELVIEALALLPPQFILTIAGSGSLRSTLEQQVVDLGLSERVTFLGWVGGEQRLALFESHDIFVLPSQNDSFGMGFVEAMAYGLPVVALNWGAIPDVVDKDKAGILIERADPTLLAEALLKLTSVKSRQAMGVHGKQWVLQQFSIDSVAAKLAEAVEQVMSEERR